MNSHCFYDGDLLFEGLVLFSSVAQLTERQTKLLLTSKYGENYHCLHKHECDGVSKSCYNPIIC